MVKKQNSIDLRIVPVLIKPIVNDLLSSKSYSPAYELLVKLQVKDMTDFMTLALNSLSDLDPISHKIIQQTGDP